MSEAPYRKSGFFNNRVLNPLIVAFGAMPSVRVRGRTSGRLYTMPVLPLEYQGKRYLVAPRGNTQWARNLRAAGEGQLRTKGRTQRFRATEIPEAERGPLVEAYVRENGSKYGGFVAKEFAALPDPADHPVFLLEDAPRTP
ncbi:MAG: nitroreductase/quinone reductase family protein [Candidatus Dormibacteraeota bacterium]|nr:nitroreductase/quinone reductase family protein [Candidatus Dormibacteraeota bacterium]